MGPKGGLSLHTFTTDAQPLVSLPLGSQRSLHTRRNTFSVESQKWVGKSDFHCKGIVEGGMSIQ